MNNPFERLTTEFNIKDSGTVSFIYGSVNQEKYILKQENAGSSKTKLTDLQFLMWNYAVVNDFDILFVTQNAKGHCLDMQSAERIFRAIQDSQSISLGNRTPHNTGFSKFHGRDLSKNLVDEINSGNIQLQAPGIKDNFFPRILGGGDTTLALNQLANDLSTKLIYNDSFRF